MLAMALFYRLLSSVIFPSIHLFDIAVIEIVSSACLVFGDEGQVKLKQPLAVINSNLVGTTGFEPATFSSQN